MHRGIIDHNPVLRPAMTQLPLGVPPMSGTHISLATIALFRAQCVPQTYQKVVFIKEAITEDVANNMIALTLYLDSLDQKRIYYWLNCPGGDVSGRGRASCSFCFAGGMGGPAT